MINVSSSTSRLASLIKAGFRVLLISGPGQAKTARIQAVADLLGWRFFYGIDGRTCDQMDRLDAAGAVVPDTAAGVTRTLPLLALKEIYDCRTPAIWFLDEIGRAPLDVQGALNSAMDYLRRNGSPVVVVAATNRPQDKAGVAALSEQLRSRFDVAFAVATPDARTADPSGATYLCDWATEVDGWCHYATTAGFDEAIIAWHRSTAGRTLYAWKPSADAGLRMPDYRSWEVVARLMKAGLADVDTVGAAIGKGHAAEFLAFAALKAQLPTPAEVWADPVNARVPTDPAASYFVASILSRACTVKNVPAFLTYIARLGRVYTALAARDVHVLLGGKLANVPDWNAFYVANQTLFR